MENSQEFMQEWEKTNNPFYPNEMPADGLKYVGTYLEQGGALVWHLFEII